MFTPKSDYLHIIKHTQLVSVDLIILDNDDNVLLGLRQNEPAKNCWFVPGARVFKNENLKRAINRIAKDEIGLILSDTTDIKLYGVYDHVYDNNFANNNFGTRYIVFAHTLRVNREEINLVCDEQHSNLKWFSVKEILENKKVHKFVKYYFHIDPKNKIL